MLQEPLPQQTMPVPEPTLDTQEFWDGCNRGELLLQQCDDCGRHQYPPKPLCSSCQSFALTWRRHDGRGHVYSWVIPHHPVHPMVEAIVPYVVALVEVPEGPRIVTRLVDVAVDEVREGMPVEVVFTEIAEGVSVPCFRPAAEDARS